MDFEKILVSDFAYRSWPLGKDQALGGIDSQDPQEPLAQDPQKPLAQDSI
jgi:hypothetical protein